MKEFPEGLKIATVFGLLLAALFLAAQWYLARQERSAFRVEGTGRQAVWVIDRARDGHYHWPGKIGDVDVVFMIDTGASRTSVSQKLADQAGLKSQGKASFSTANGLVVGALAKADLQLEGGLAIDRQVVAVLPKMDGVALLGMDVLGKLKIEQSQQQLRISAADLK
jgi:aspartyl protease family protein